MSGRHYLFRFCRLNYLYQFSKTRKICSRCLKKKKRFCILCDWLEYIILICDVLLLDVLFVIYFVETNKICRLLLLVTIVEGWILFVSESSLYSDVCSSMDLLFLELIRGYHFCRQIKGSKWINFLCPSFYRATFVCWLPINFLYNLRFFFFGFVFIVLRNFNTFVYVSFEFYCIFITKKF